MKKRGEKRIKSLRQSASKQLVSHKNRFGLQWLLFFLIGTACFLIIYCGKLNHHAVLTRKIIQLRVSASKPLQTLDELLKLSPAEINQCDIALMDLLCVQDLPGAGDTKIKSYLDTLDEWAKHVQAETERNFHQYRKGVSPNNKTKRWN